MSTRRRCYRIDVTLRRDHDPDWYTLKRTCAADLPWCWCPHCVRATSLAKAHAKALADHQHRAACQALDQQVRDVKAQLGLE